MRRLVMLIVLGALLLPCAVMAQFDPVEETRHPEGPCWWAVGVEWGDRGDDGDGVGVRVDHMFPALGNCVQVGASWGDGESLDTVGEAYLEQAGLVAVGTDVYSLEASYIAVREEEKFDWWFGGGPSWHKVDGPGWSDESIGGQALVGIGHPNGWYAELRYVFATEFDWGFGETSDVDGLRFVVGYRR